MDFMIFRYSSVVRRDSRILRIAVFFAAMLRMDGDWRNSVIRRGNLAWKVAMHQAQAVIA